MVESYESQCSGSRRELEGLRELYGHLRGSCEAGVAPLVREHVVDACRATHGMAADRRVFAQARVHPGHVREDVRALLCRDPPEGRWLRWQDIAASSSSPNNAHRRHTAFPPNLPPELRQDAGEAREGGLGACPFSGQMPGLMAEDPESLHETVFIREFATSGAKI